MDRAKAIIAHKKARRILLMAGLINMKTYRRPVKPAPDKTKG